MRPCQECGQPLAETAKKYTRFCDACKRKHKAAAAKKRAEYWKARREMQKIEKPIRTLAEVQREAQERGMSYGQYVAMMRR